MSHIEGDGVIEDLYYLLWRKDSPFKEKINLRIPDTITFHCGRPMAWYFTNNEGVVLRKKQANLTYPEIVKKFVRGMQEGDIVACFINIDEKKKLSRLLDKNSKGQDDDDESIPMHKVDYFGLKDFIETFSDYKNFENKTGILQKFINPYSDHNELIQAIWSPRVCVFNKRVNLRRLNEIKFDIYERALTFDGPEFYSKNVPLRGGFIPGKLRGMCDLIVRHIGYVSYEKISIKRMVGYFKVDRNENVWFLWTSSIRIKETSKMHKATSKFVNTPLCLEPCLQTNDNIRLIKSNFSTKPVSLRLNESCTICLRKFAANAMIPVSYKLLLTNEETMKKSDETNEGVKIRPSSGNTKMKPININKGTLGVPDFVKRLHPGITAKDYNEVKDSDHFLMMKTDVCEECYLLVSGELESGYPYKLAEPPRRPQTTTAARSKNIDFSNQGTKYDLGPTEGISLINEESHNKTNIDDNTSSRPRTALYIQDEVINPPIDRHYILKARAQTSKNKRLESDELFIEPIKSTKHSSTGLEVANKAAENVYLRKFLRSDAWKNASQSTNPNDYDSYLSGNRGNSTNADHSTLKRDLVKALGGDYETMMKNRIQSAKEPETTLRGSNNNARPQTSAVNGVNRGNSNGRQLKLKENVEITIPNNYRVSEIMDIFADSVSNVSGFESLATKHRSVASAKTDTLPSFAQSRPYMMTQTSEYGSPKNMDRNFLIISSSQDEKIGKMRSQSGNILSRSKPPVNGIPGILKKTSTIAGGAKGMSKRSEERMSDYLTVYSGLPRTKSSTSSLRSNFEPRFFRGDDDSPNEKDIEQELEDQVDNLMSQPGTSKNSTKR